jgi:hypothetical protein
LIHDEPRVWDRPDDGGVRRGPSFWSTHQANDPNLSLQASRSMSFVPMKLYSAFGRYGLGRVSGDRPSWSTADVRISWCTGPFYAGPWSTLPVEGKEAGATFVTTLDWTLTWLPSRRSPPSRPSPLSLILLVKSRISAFWQTMICKW